MLRERMKGNLDLLLLAVLAAAPAHGYQAAERGHRQLAPQRREWAAFTAGVAAVLGEEPA